VTQENLPVENKGRVDALEDRTDRTEQRMDKIADDISEIKTKLLNRPTPFTTFLLSSLSFVTASAITWALTVLNLVIKID